MLVRPFAAVSLLCLLVSLSACSTKAFNPLRKEMCFEGYVNEELLETELAASPGCCQGFAGMTFQEIPLPRIDEPTGGRQGAVPEPEKRSPRGPHVVNISRVADIYAFPQGKSRFAALDLSSLDFKPRQLTVVPLRSGLTATAKVCSERRERRRYFRPLVTFLDASRQPLAAGLPGTPTRVDIHAGLHFDIPERARYAIVHGSPAALGTPFVLEGGTRYDLMAVPGAGVLLPMPVDGRVDGTATSTGGLELHFK